MRSVTDMSMARVVVSAVASTDADLGSPSTMAISPMVDPGELIIAMAVPRLEMMTSPERIM
ncbi:MAG: hypothetical protein BWX71_01509 [Deltaproteobacteria bacterium ADurb.Bin072]|nr:MAG: hypothetical protein BWX71_01509 [Deltaproteobacteria bacterium ADurb.Bin072]